MGWNDFVADGVTRADLAVKLWKDGLTASAIASQVGGGISRNAVIGKVHRMGAATYDRSYRRTTKNGPRTRKPRAPRPKRVRYTSEAAIAERAALNELAAERQAVQLGPDLIVPPHERKGLLDLEAGDCKWPFGDPKQADFHFCNGKAVSGQPYCEFHCKRAYAPPTYRPRVISRAMGQGTKDTVIAPEFDAMERA